MPSNRKRRIRQLMAESNMSYQAVLNSLENRGGQQNPVPWLIEKTAIALGEAARLVDLANEPDTNTWYRQTLKGAAHRILARLAPVVTVLCDRPEAANEPHKWESIAEGGSPALHAWMVQHSLELDIGDCIGPASARVSTPHRLADHGSASHPIANQRDERIEKPPIPAGVPNRGDIQARLLTNCSVWLLGHEVSEATRRLLLWIMMRLDGGEYVDVVTLSRRFLANDICATSADTAEAYRTLCEASVLERADYLPAPENPDSEAPARSSYCDISAFFVAIRKTGWKRHQRHDSRRSRSCCHLRYDAIKAIHRREGSVSVIGLTGSMAGTNGSVILGRRLERPRVLHGREVA